MRFFSPRRRRHPVVLSLESLEERRVLDSTVVFNEVMYHPPADNTALEWIELHNQMSVAVNLSGWSLQNAVDFIFPAGTILEGGQYLVVSAAPDELRATTGLSEDVVMGPYRGQLSNAGERIELRNHTNRFMDLLEYDDEGDWPAAADGSGASLAKISAQAATEPIANWTFSPEFGGTPGHANFSRESHQLTLLPLDAQWRYDQSGQAPAASWQSTDFDDSDWLVGQGLFYVESSDLPGPKNTPLDLGSRAYYFRTTFEVPENFEATDLQLGHVIDDGAVFYLNGQEVGRLNMPDGVATYESLASSSVINATYRTLHLPSELLRDGSNTLAVEVHQVFDTSNDVVFGTELFVELSASEGDGRGALQFHEVTAAGGADFWVELHNRGLQPLSLAGYVLAGSENVSAAYTLPSQMIPVGGFYVVSAALLGIVPQVDERLFLWSPQRTQVVDAVRLTDHPLGRSTQHGGRWQVPSKLSPGEPNRFEFQDQIVINEIMYHARPQYASVAESTGQDDANATVPYEESAEEWIELYNRGDQTVDLSNWQLADAVEFEFAVGTTLAPGQYLVIANDVADFLQRHPGIRVVGEFSGRLSDYHERIQLLDGRGNRADEVHYYDGGRWPESADAGGSSLELRDPWADNSRGEAWAASDETGRSEWHHFSYTRTVESIIHDPPIYFHEFVMGLLNAGEMWVDNVSVIENPGGAERELIQNGTFQTDAVGEPAAKWRLVGTHRESEVVEDPAQPGSQVLRLVAESRMSYLSNHAETTLAEGARVVNGQTYQISFDAKWITGSPQLHTELYYKDAARTADSSPTLSQRDSRDAETPRGNRTTVPHSTDFVTIH